MFKFLKKVLGKKLDNQTKEELFDYLISSDFGVQKSEELLKKLSYETENTKEKIKDYLLKDLRLLQSSSLLSLKTQPTVMVFLGINGAGKTTVLAKTANYYKSQGKKVIIGACDTYRASATSQLEELAKRTGVDLIKDDGKDPASVAYKTYEKALQENYDLCLIDTAGRLSNNENLMNELKKIILVLEKLNNEKDIIPILVLDGTSGQNAISQTEKFSKYINVKGLIINKMDTSSKAGFIFQLTDKKIPVLFLGVGEKTQDIIPFTAEDFLSDF